jgi:hypothetical protein
MDHKGACRKCGTAMLSITEGYRATWVAGGSVRHTCSAMPPRRPYEESKGKKSVA